MSLQYYRNDDRSLERLAGFHGVFEGAELWHGYDTNGIYTAIAYYPDGRTEIRTGDDAIRQITNINTQAFFQETDETRKTREIVQWLNTIKSKIKCMTT